VQSSPKHANFWVSGGEKTGKTTFCSQYLASKQSAPNSTILYLKANRLSLFDAEDFCHTPNLVVILDDLTERLFLQLYFDYFPIQSPNLTLFAIGWLPDAVQASFSPLVFRLPNLEERREILKLQKFKNVSASDREYMALRTEYFDGEELLRFVKSYGHTIYPKQGLVEFKKRRFWSAMQFLCFWRFELGQIRELGSIIAKFAYYNCMYEDFLPPPKLPEKIND
jgi:hypothetical protein